MGHPISYNWYKYAPGMGASPNQPCPVSRAPFRPRAPGVRALGALSRIREKAHAARVFVGVCLTLPRGVYARPCIREPWLLAKTE